MKISTADPRYAFAHCPTCDRDWQFLDYGCARHRLTCDPDRGPSAAARDSAWTTAQADAAAREE